jgi:hypothetical protein
MAAGGDDTPTARQCIRAALVPPAIEGTEIGRGGALVLCSCRNPSWQERKRFVKAVGTTGKLFFERPGEEDEI